MGVVSHDHGQIKEIIFKRLEPNNVTHAINDRVQSPVQFRVYIHASLRALPDCGLDRTMNWRDLSGF